MRERDMEGYNMLLGTYLIRDIYSIIAGHALDMPVNLWRARLGEWRAALLV